MKRRFLSTLMALVLALSLVPTAAFAAEGETVSNVGTEETTEQMGVVSYNGTTYTTIADAVAEIHQLTGNDRMQDHVITLTDDITCAGFGVGYETLTPSESGGFATADGNNPVNITIDLAGHTYTVSTTPTVGSGGTETNTFQFLKNSKVTFKNGNIVSSTSNFLFQNYCDLTLDNVNITATNASYVMSNNCGNILLTGNTSITAGENKKAFDVCWWPTSYPEGAKVTINTTGTIVGDIELGTYGSLDGQGTSNSTLNIQNGTFRGKFSIDSSLTGQAAEKISITGGTFSANVSAYIPSGMKQEEGKVVIDNESAVASVNGVGYDDLQEAIDVAGNGDTVKLLKDIVSEAVITIDSGQDITLDLGGNTLTVNKTVAVVDTGLQDGSVPSFFAHIINSGDSLVIQNGTIVGNYAAAVIANRSGTLDIRADTTLKSINETYNNSTVIQNLGGTVTTAGQLISIANSGICTYGGTVQVTGGMISAKYYKDLNNCASGITVFNRGYNNTSNGANVTISGGTIEAAVYAASTNNLYSGGDNPSSLTITGGTVTATQSSAIYWPSAGTLTIGTKGSTSGPIINSPKGSAVEICSGTLNVYGGTLNGGTEMTADDRYETDQSLVNGYRGNSGSAGTGDAVTVISRRGSGYDTAPLNVNIEGGTFTSPQNYGVRYMDCNLAESATEIEQTVDVKITGGSFDGGIAAVDAKFVEESDKDFISGGNYSDSVVDYLTADMTAQLYSTSDSETPYSYYQGVEAAQNAAGPNDVITDLSPDVGTSVTYYTITLNNGDTVYNKYFIKANGSFTLPSAPSSSSNQRFDGWSLYGTLYQPGQTFTVTKPMTFDAMWTEVSSSGSGSSDPSYSPVLDISDGGTVKVNPRTPGEGDEVTITVDPDRGYEVGDVTVTDRNGREVDVTAGRNGTYTFEQPRGRVTIEVTFVPTGTVTFFTDVPESFWAYDEIKWAYDNGYVNGTTATTFSPNGSITRQQVWMILARLSGADPANMAAARTWAIDNGISDGTNPGSAVTRQQLVALLYRYATLMGYANDARADLSVYPDAGTVASYAVEPMQWSVANNIVAGTSDGILNPTGTATRAQFAVILYRFMA